MLLQGLCRRRSPVPVIKCQFESDMSLVADDIGATDHVRSWRESTAERSRVVDKAFANSRLACSGRSLLHCQTSHHHSFYCFETTNDCIDS